MDLVHGAVTSGSWYGVEFWTEGSLVRPPGAWRRAVLGLRLTCGLGEDVPGAVPVGAVAHGSVVHLYPLSCRDYLASSVTIGTF